MAETVDPHGSTLICDALTAYRRDLARTPDVVRFGEDDAPWLRLALHLERLTAPVTGPVRRTASLATHAALQPTRLLATAERMESAGALTLTYTVLAAARRVWDAADPASAGVAILRQARICRLIGATPAAENFYVHLFSYATQHRLPESRGRALVGRGILRLMEGDPAAARRWFAKARAVSGGNPAALGVAYHADMFAALAQKDYNRALVAGWKARATESLRSFDEAGVLVNMASIALQANHPDVALRTVRAALRLTAQPRVRVLGYAKGALAAAHLGRRSLVDKFAARLVATAATANFPPDELEARSELAMAFAILGDQAKARRQARTVRRDALLLGLGHVARRCEALLVGELATEPSVTLSAPARRVVRLLQEA